MNRPGRPGRGAPGGSTPAAANGRGILLLVVAFIIGVAVLRSTETGGGSASSQAGSRTTTTRAGRATTLVPVSTTTPAHPIAEVTVLPVNSSGIGGAAGKTADKLKASGYTNTLAATNAPEGESPMPASIIEYAPGAEADAAAVAKVLSLPESVLKPLAPPWDTDSRKPQVVVLVGGELAAAFAGATTTTTGG